MDILPGNNSPEETPLEKQPSQRNSSHGKTASSSNFWTISALAVPLGSFAVAGLVLANGERGNGSWAIIPPDVVIALLIAVLGIGAGIVAAVIAYRNKEPLTISRHSGLDK